MAGFCERVDEIFGFLKGSELLGCLRNWFSKKFSVSLVRQLGQSVSQSPVPVAARSKT